ncbi:MAG: ABC transporter permease [Promethearchaeota archaeon]
MSIDQNQELLEHKQTIAEKKKVGLIRRITQIIDTIKFELTRNWKSFVLMLIVYFAVFLLHLIIYELEEANGVELPEESIDYITEYFDMLGFLIIISTATFGGAIIAEDFKKQTGNLLFPKISKTRLLIGRTISRYSLNATLIIFYYTLVASITNYKYDELPDTYIDSMGWALLYTFMIFTFIIFMSSINRSKASAIIISILFLLIVFNIIRTVLMFTRIEVEPLFLLTYYENIITASLDMPDPRYEEVSFGPRDEEDPVEFKRWLTPSESGALIGMFLFSIIFLIVALLIYKKRQSKNE